MSKLFRSEIRAEKKAGEGIASGCSPRFLRVSGGLSGLEALGVRLVWRYPRCPSFSDLRSGRRRKPGKGLQAGVLRVFSASPGFFPVWRLLELDWFGGIHDVEAFPIGDQGGEESRGRDCKRVFSAFSPRLRGSFRSGGSWS